MADAMCAWPMLVRSCSHNETRQIYQSKIKFAYSIYYSAFIAITLFIDRHHNRCHRKLTEAGHNAFEQSSYAHTTADTFIGK